MGVAVVHRVRLDRSGEDGRADRVHADVAAGNESLELRRTVAQAIQPRELLVADAAHDRSDSARRLVDHFAVLRLKGAHRVRIARHQGWRHAESGAANDDRLIRLRVVGEAAADRLTTGQAMSSSSAIKPRSASVRSTFASSGSRPGSGARSSVPKAVRKRR